MPHAGANLPSAGLDAASDILLHQGEVIQLEFAVIMSENILM